MICEPLALIINQSTTTGNFPERLKVTKVKVLFKKDDVHNMNNFRPISVLPSISKVMKKALLQKLHLHFHLYRYYRGDVEDETMDGTGKQDTKNGNPSQI